MSVEEIIAEFRSWHKRYTDNQYEEGTGRLIEWEGCEGCDHESWPCPTIVLCDAYEALLAQASRSADLG
jgi:hypothetical protein